MHAAGYAEFLVDARALRSLRAGSRLAGFDCLGKARLERGTDFDSRRRVDRVQTPGGIDVEISNPGFDDIADLGLPLDPETVPQERVRHPAAVEIVYEHPRLKFRDGDSLDH